MVEPLLARLSGVRKSGAGWVARCPAHEDHSPSLSVTEKGGYVLLKCFAGCETGDVLSAVGLSFADVMPERLEDQPPRRARPDISAMDVLRALSLEVQLVGLLAADILAGKKLSETDWERLATSSARITAAKDFIDGY